MNYEEKLNELKKNLDESKDLKFRAELKLEQLKKEEEDLIEQLKELGVDADKLEDVINELEIEISRGLKEAESMLPLELLNDK